MHAPCWPTRRSPSRTWRVGWASAHPRCIAICRRRVRQRKNWNTHSAPNPCRCKVHCMSNVHPLLPRLIVNGTFINDFLAAAAPCFALGVVEERKQQYGFLAIRPDVPIPDHATQAGFRLGHSLIGTSEYEVVLFTFEIRDPA